MLTNIKDLRKERKKAQQDKKGYVLESPSIEGELPSVTLHGTNTAVSEEMNMPAQQKLMLVNANLKKIAPYYWSMYTAIRKVPVPSYVCKTMGVTENMMIYNNAFVAEQNIGELTFIVLHEMYHIAMYHPLRIRANGIDTKMMNVAQDLYVNECICKEFDVWKGCGEVNINGGVLCTPEQGVFLSTIDETLDFEKDTAESIYYRLMAENQSNGNGSGSGQGQQQNSQGQGQGQEQGQSDSNNQQGSQNGQGQGQGQSDSNSQQDSQDGQGQGQGQSDSNSQQDSQDSQGQGQGQGQQGNNNEQSTNNGSGQGGSDDMQNGQGQNGAGGSNNDNEQSQNNSGQGNSNSSSGENGQEGSGSGQQEQGDSNSGGGSPQQFKRDDGISGDENSESNNNQGDSSQNTGNNSNNGQGSQGQSQDGQMNGDGENMGDPTQSQSSGLDSQGNGVDQSESVLDNLTRPMQDEDYVNKNIDIDLIYKGKHLRGLLNQDIMSNHSDDSPTAIEDARRDTKDTLNKILVKRKMDEQKSGMKMVGGPQQEIIERSIDFALAKPISWEKILDRFANKKPKIYNE